MGSRDDSRVPDPLVPPTLLVVVLGLLASIGWGVGDFGGGLTSRWAPVLGVLFTSQLASLVVAGPLFVIAGERPMSADDLLLSGLGGVFGASGLALLYRGLSIGRMGVVMPIAAVITAAMPVAFGFVTEGIPAALAIAGIVLAAVGVVLVSLSPGSTEGGRSGIAYGVATGVMFGMFPIVTSGISDDLLVGPVVVVRLASIVTVAAAILLARISWRVPRRLWPAMVGIGVADMLATTAYLAAIAIGPLAIAASLTSLSNVVTVLLAALVLRERITPVHAVGIAAAATAVVLIAAA
jgi:drug/metabolite transporter (DMT)-like permease